MSAVSVPEWHAHSGWGERCDCADGQATIYEMRATEMMSDRQIASSRSDDRLALARELAEDCSAVNALDTADRIMQSDWYEATIARVAQNLAIPLRALGRLLVESGEMTPTGERMLLAVLEEMK